MTLWDWAVSAYARPGMAEAALALQDRHGQSVSFLLWAAWARPDKAQAEAAARIARAWNRAAIAPLREARRALKAAQPPVADAGREALREQVRAAELQSERLLLEALEGLARPGVAPLGSALTRACAAWGRAVPEKSLAAFAAALG